MIVRISEINLQPHHYFSFTVRRDPILVHHLFYSAPCLCSHCKMHKLDKFSYHKNMLFIIYCNDKPFSSFVSDFFPFFFGTAQRRRWHARMKQNIYKGESATRLQHQSAVPSRLNGAAESETGRVSRKEVYFPAYTHTYTHTSSWAIFSRAILLSA